MRAGLLRHKVYLQPLASTKDAMGAAVKSYSTVTQITAYASIEPLRGTEYLMGGQMDATITHRIRTRYVSGLTAGGYRIKFGSRIFDIESVINWNERNTFLELMCKENA